MTEPSHAHRSTSPFRPAPCQQQRGMAVTMAARERTFIMIKPDAVQRGLVGDIIKRFEQKGFKLVGLKFKQAGGGRSISPHARCHIA